ncbi:hypothetical protein J3F84DRAFT_345506 [Trichoderma pleuroticola]
MAPPELVTVFPAMTPQLEFQFDSQEDAEISLTDSIETIHRTIIGLIEDTAMFQAIGYHKTRTAAGEEFIQSLMYYSEVLIRVPLVKLTNELQNYTFTPAQTTSPLNLSIDTRLKNANEDFLKLVRITEDLERTAGWEISLKAPSEAHLALPKLDPGIVRVTSDAPCGRPTMIFVAGKPDLSHVVFGANETAWGNLTAVSTITRTARDTRLHHYIPLATEAFEALFQKEMKALAELQNDQPCGTSNQDDLLWRARASAIEHMRSDDSFLGGEDEMGIALRPPTWSINQGCYLCQGMMGYQSPKSWNENQRKKYILKFD